MTDLIAGLRASLSDDDPDVREAAVQALSKVFSIAPSETQKALMTDLIAMLSDDDSDVREAAVQALSKVFSIAPSETQQALSKVFSIAPSETQKALMTDLIAMLSDNDSDVREAAVQVLSKVFLIAPSETQQALMTDLITRLSNNVWQIRQATVQALSKVFSIAPSETRQALMTNLIAGLRARLSDNYFGVRRAAADGISLLAIENALPDEGMGEADKPFIFAFKAHIQKRKRVLENKNDESPDYQEKVLVEERPLKKRRML
jgi:HEAT repeat protein